MKKWHFAVIVGVILAMSVGFSAMNAEMSISGEAMVRANGRIRIENLRLSKTTDAYEKYNSSYTADTLKVMPHFEADAGEIRYAFDIKNDTDERYIIKSITATTHTNEQVHYTLSNLLSIIIEPRETWSSEDALRLVSGAADVDEVLELRLEFEVVGENEFAYRGEEQVFEAPRAGVYQIEAWGASGGSVSLGDSRDFLKGGTGGYSTGEIYLAKGEKIYINVGGMGNNNSSFCEIAANGDAWNGGSLPSCQDNRGVVNPAALYMASGGGGATSISTKTGLLSISSRSDVLMVAAGGGGASSTYNSTRGDITGSGGEAGGYIGKTGWNSDWRTPGGGGTQTGPGATSTDADEDPRVSPAPLMAAGFGQACSPKTSYDYFMFVGGGGGWYGGGCGSHAGGGGGSSYIANSRLSNKKMYCHDCEESTAESTYTVSTSCKDRLPVSNCAKEGSGYVKISYIGVQSGDFWDFPFTGSESVFSIPKSGTYKIEAWGAAGGTAIGSSGTFVGGRGGYAYASVALSEDVKIYINSGGMGKSVTNVTAVVNNGSGYNGGGGLTHQSSTYFNSGGGGASSVALASGLLKNLASNQSSVLVVAGGGGGSASSNNGNSSTDGFGGAGGGLTGGTGSNTSSNPQRDPGTGGMQTGPGSTATYNNNSPLTVAGFGQGCDVRANYSDTGYMLVSGGGGWYGGGCGVHAGGGGGSSYVVTNGGTSSGAESMPNPNSSTTMVGNAGNGYVRVTYIGD